MKFNLEEVIETLNSEKLSLNFNRNTIFRFVTYKKKKLPHLLQKILKLQNYIIRLGILQLNVEDNMSDKTKVSIQIGSFPTLLTIAFIVLKLYNVISWSWWWILSPIWIPIAITIIGLLFLFILYIIYE